MAGLAGAALLGLAFFVFAPHVRHGGFYADDWANAAAYHFEGWRRTSLYEWRHNIPARPILAFLHPLPYALFGLDPAYHVAAAVVLAVLTSLAFFAFLRTLGVELPHALALAGLSLFFPWADAARLWPTGAANNVAVIAYFAGSIAALRGLALRRVRPRGALALHAFAAALYLVSLLTYEVAAGAILLSGLLYRTRASWRELGARWAVDAAVVLVPLVVSLRVTSRVRHVGSLSERAEDVPHFVGAGLSLFASIFVPWDVAAGWSVGAPTAAKLAVLGAAGGVVSLAISRCRACDDFRLRIWLYRGAAGVCGVAAAYVMFLGSGLVPLYFPGVDDRTNTFAAFGFVTAAYAVVVLLSLLLRGGRGRVAAAVVTVGVALVAFGFVQRVRDDIAQYDAAAAAQRSFLERVHAVLPHPPRGATIFTFGYPAQTAPGVPIFVHSWDTRGAVDLRWDDRSLRAAPVYGSGVSCDRTGVRALRLGSESAAAYGRAVFVDVPTGRTRRIRSPAACTRARRVFAPGPVLATSLRR